jgi:hypothetical protein
VATSSQKPSRGSLAKVLSLRFGDDEGGGAKEEEKVEEVELAESTPEGEDIEELREFMFNMLKSLLFDLVVGELNVTICGCIYRFYNRWQKCLI